MNAPGYDFLTGNGFVNALAAVEKLLELVNYERELKEEEGEKQCAIDSFLFPVKKSFSKEFNLPTSSPTTSPSDSPLPTSSPTTSPSDSPTASSPPSVSPPPTASPVDVPTSF